MDSPLTQHQHFFDRSLKTIEGVKALFIDAEKLFGGSTPDFEILKQQLENPFAIFVCGEFNSGKSSLLNRLGGAQLAEVGILPTTSEIQAYKPEGFEGLVFIDSPGTNSIIERHQELTESYLQRADIILFITSVERPLSKSEQEFLLLVNHTWVRKVIVVVNKADLATSKELEQVLSYVQQGLKEVFKENTPVFALSARTGEGIDQLQASLLEILAETERIKLKLQGPQSSLLVYLEQLEHKNKEVHQQLLTEKKIFDQTLKRIEDRIEQYDLIFGVFQAKISDLFNSLIQQLNQVVEDSLAFLTLLRQRFTREDDLLEQKIAKAIKDVKLDERMEEIVQQGASTVIKYREQILREAKEDLQLAASLSNNSFDLATLDTKEIDVGAISEKLKLASQKGMNNFLTLGTVAAATGIGGHVIATAALFDLSAFVLAIMLTMFSLNAVPKQRDQAKQQLENTLKELQVSYTDKLQQSLQQELMECLQQFTNSLKPRMGELEKQIGAAQERDSKISGLRQEINHILQEISDL